MWSLTPLLHFPVSQFKLWYWAQCQIHINAKKNPSQSSQSSCLLNKTAERLTNPLPRGTKFSWNRNGCQLRYRNWRGRKHTAAYLDNTYRNWRGRKHTAAYLDNTFTNNIDRKQTLNAKFITCDMKFSYVFHVCNSRLTYHNPSMVTQTSSGDTVTNHPQKRWHSATNDFWNQILKPIIYLRPICLYFLII